MAKSVPSLFPRCGVGLLCFGSAAGATGVSGLTKEVKRVGFAGTRRKLVRTGDQSTVGGVKKLNRTEFFTRPNKNSSAILKKKFAGLWAPARERIPSALLGEQTALYLVSHAL